MKKFKNNLGNGLLIGLILIAASATAQTTVSGIIKNENKGPLAGVSISIEDSYDGATSSEDGKFSFVTSEKGIRKLVLSMMGYKSIEKIINLDTTRIVIELVMQESATELQLVTVTAGSFEASDRKRRT